MISAFNGDREERERWLERLKRHNLVRDAVLARLPEIHTHVDGYLAEKTGLEIDYLSKQLDQAFFEAMKLDDPGWLVENLHYYQRNVGKILTQKADQEAEGYRTSDLRSSLKSVYLLREQRETLRLEGIKGDLVFPTSTGTLIDETNTWASLRRIIKRANPRLEEWLRDRASAMVAAGVPKSRAREVAVEELDRTDGLRRSLTDVKTITFHDLRHTFASMMIANGVDVVRLSRILGHRDPSFTLKTYAHFFERRERPSMPSLDSLLGSIGGTDGGQTASGADGTEEGDAA